MYLFIDAVRKIFKGGGKSTKLILLGVALTALSSYMPSSTSVHFQNVKANAVFLWFGILSLAYGFVLYSIEAYEESKEKILMR